MALSYRSRRVWRGIGAFLLVLALVLSCMFTWLPVLKNVSSGLAIVICTVAAAALCAWLFPIPDEEGAEA